MGLWFFLGGLFLGALVVLFLMHFIPEKEPHFHIAPSKFDVPKWSNRPRPITFFVNSRGRKIYYEQRGDPSNKKCKGVLFVNVGYSAHTMRPTKHLFFEELAKVDEKGRFFCVATFDWEGAGYSEGVRTLVEPEGMLNDLEQFVELVMEDAPDALKWYCVGQSMAGAAALLFSKRIFNRNFSHYSAYGGCIAVAPLVTLDKPPAPILMIMKSIAILFPTCLIPEIVQGDISNAAVWTSQEVRDWHATHDVWGVPGALGWGKSVRWGSARALINMSDAVLSMVHNNEVSFPLLVLHDPEDKVTHFKGTRLLIEKSKSPNTQLTEMPGCKHDLMSNEPIRVAANIHKWIDSLNS